MPIQLIHPALVHFPIVFVISLLAVDVYAVWRGVPLTPHSGLGRASIILTALAALSAIAAFIFGDRAFDIALAAGTPEAVLEPHEQMGTMTTAFIAGWAVLRGLAFWRQLAIGTLLAGGVVLAEVVLVGLILTTALYGGQLVYEHGVGVIAHSAG
ncbi:MAG: DUF2231 domain-containing protein [Hyphomicrobiaceae bacterium]|jgi:uncharacterized membrane protein